MTQFDRILVPLDGSPRAEAVLPWLRRLPAREIRLLQVCPDEASHTDEVNQYLDDLAATLAAPRRTVETRVVTGSPAEAIVAEAADASLVVMCTQGAGGGGRRVYGSVADRVSRHAPAPTLLLRGGDDPVAEGTVRRIVVPLDGSPAAERALPMAATLARIMDAPVQLITICDEGDADASSSSRHPETALARLTALVSRLGEQGVPAAAETRTGEPAAELLQSIVPGDVIVATTHGEGTARRWQIGHVAEKLLRQAAAPILLIRTDVA